jgi:hypothetical protein
MAGTHSPSTLLKEFRCRGTNAWRHANRRTAMKSQIAATAFAFLVGTSWASAHNRVVIPSVSQPTVVTPETTRSTTVIAPEREKVIREYVHKKPLYSISIFVLDMSFV